jgi:prephenate dehydrogenase
MYIRTVGIIGIEGKYGKWLKNFFEERGSVVIGSDIKGTKFTNRQVVEKADVIIFSVPINCIVEVVKEVVPLSHEDQLWMDIASFKGKLVDVMLESKADVVSLHPMCAPTVKSLRGQTIIVHKARVTKQWDEWVESFLWETGARIKITPPEEHDKYMAIVQGLPHATNLIMAFLVRSMGINVSESMEFTSPFYRVALSLMGRIISQNPQLYADIQMSNPNIPAMLSELDSQLTRFREIVESRDSQAFVAEFNACKEYFGEKQLKSASNLFDDLIKLMADLSDENMISIEISEDKSGVLNQITGFFFKFDINLTSFHSQKIGENLYRFLIGIDSEKYSSKVVEAISKIRKIPGVKVLD